jgi:hypothetical protein
MTASYGSREGCAVAIGKSCCESGLNISMLSWVEGSVFQFNSVKM